MSLALTGKLSAPGELISTFADSKPLELNGIMSVPGELISTYSDDEPLELTGHLTIPEYIGETYKGSYEVVPTADFQLLSTADCILVEDILVHSIPYYEVSNEQGGLTVTIG